MRTLTKQLFFITVAGAALPTLAATDDVIRVSFTTESQRVPPGVLSDVITLQAQNSLGEIEKIDGTADVQFFSSSPTGEFLNSFGSPVATTMSKGSANRNFYYRDTTVGTHVLMATVRLRGSTLVWSATQDITISSRTLTPTRSATPHGTMEVASVEKAALALPPPVVIPTATPVRSLVLPYHRSWWQIFIDMIFAH